VSRDDSKALEYYRLSARQGDMDAQAALKRLQSKSAKSERRNKRAAAENSMENSQEAT
jgi:TPR repeat protein